MSIESDSSGSECLGVLAQEVVWAFGADGPLGEEDPRFRHRPQQVRMAQAVANALDGQSVLVVEAGTGVGKTFAYLTPLLLWGKQVIISTATKTLQDQLFFRDLPEVSRRLRRPVVSALLKGRSSYLCLYRFEQAQSRGQFDAPWASRLLHRISRWSLSTESGDLSEVDGLDESSALMPWVTSTRDNCLGTECPRFSDCFVVKARRRALASQVVVVNHHLFFADWALRDHGVGEILPSAQAVVFDEAHQMVETGLQFLSTSLGTAVLIDLSRDLLQAGHTHARGLCDWAASVSGLEQSARDLRLWCAQWGAAQGSSQKIPWQALEDQEGLFEILQVLEQRIDQTLEEVHLVMASHVDWIRLEQRFVAVKALVARFCSGVAPRHLRWIELSPHQARLVEAPLDLRKSWPTLIQSKARGWIFTSATLGADENASWFRQAMGMDQARTLQVNSPFDYGRQARLWIARDLPQPNDRRHSEAVGELAADLAQRLGGRTFVLTTTLRAIRPIAQAIEHRLNSGQRTFEVLVQGGGSRRELLADYGQGHGKVLVGAQSFWEGVDMPGDALQCVIIDKLPFPPPHDPVVQARSRQAEEEGRSGFQEVFVCEAAIALKQGVGRLVRSESDCGLVVICDSRMAHKGYGHTLRAALPPMGDVMSRQEALDWLDQMRDPQ